MAAGLLISAPPPSREEVEEATSMFRAFRQSPLPSVGISARQSLVRAVSLNERLQTMLHPWTSYVIVPLFALANAGVDLRDGVLADALSSPITWGVVLALVVGKLVGIGVDVAGHRAARARLASRGGSGPARCSAARRSRASASRSRC